MTNALFGGKPKRPKLQTVAQPIEKVQQSNIADETTRRNYTCSLLEGWDYFFAHVDTLRSWCYRVPTQ